MPLPYVTTYCFQKLGWSKCFITNALEESGFPVASALLEVTGILDVGIVNIWKEVHVVQPYSYIKFIFPKK